MTTRMPVSRATSTRRRNSALLMRTGRVTVAAPSSEFLRTVQMRGAHLSWNVARIDAEAHELLSCPAS